MRTNQHFYFKTFGLLMLFLLSFAQTFAQNKTISGTVTNTEGEPIPFANILVEGSSTGTAADMDGFYTIEAGSDDILVFSYVGFKTKEIAVS